MTLDYFKDVHKGETALIIAGGPSLKNTNLEALPSHWTRLGVSLTYRGVEDINYQFIGDRNIYSQVWQELYEHTFDRLFVSARIYQEFQVDKDWTEFFVGAPKGFYGHDVTRGVYGGGTSTYLAMQFAFYMGFQTVYIVGLDHSWNFSETEKVGEGSGGDLLIHKDKDTNHFSEDFYPPNIKWFKPKVDKMLESYIMAGEAYREAGRNLINASIQTKVPDSVIERAPIAFRSKIYKDESD